MVEFLFRIPLTNEWTKLNEEREREREREIPFSRFIDGGILLLKIDRDREREREREENLCRYNQKLCALTGNIINNNLSINLDSSDSLYNR